MNDTDIQHSTTTPAAAHSPLEVLLIFLKLGVSCFGGPIAHGYLTLSLSNLFLPQIVEVRGISAGLNRGTGKVRFPSPVPVGSRLRASARMEAATDVPGTPAWSSASSSAVCCTARRSIGARTDTTVASAARTVRTTTAAGRRRMLLIQNGARFRCISFLS